LFLEFLPIVLERLGWKRQLRWLHTVMVPLVILGVILSTLHQSSLGSLYLIVPGKLYPLWYSPLEPLFFYLSALCAGLAMVIFESWRSGKAFGKALEPALVTGLGRVLAVLLLFYLTLRGMDLQQRGAWGLLTRPRTETYLFLLEISLLMLPTLLLFWRRIHCHPARLYLCAVFTLLGFICNRMNVAITGMEASSGLHYFPKWTELAVTLSLVAAGFTLFALAAKYLPIFTTETARAPEEPGLLTVAPALGHAGD
jgi:Ni/Fe-hydrogenase subunit HybB-like protein